jgi:hypothetical protein
MHQEKEKREGRKLKEKGPHCSTSPGGTGEVL